MGADRSYIRKIGPRLHGEKQDVKGRGRGRRKKRGGERKRGFVAFKTGPV